MSEKPLFTTHAIVAGYSLTFKWWGGEYIEVCWRGGECFEVINVWDADTNGSRIERTREAFMLEVAEWVEDASASDLKEYNYGR
jgi:hypothetical protein